MRRSVFINLALGVAAATVIVLWLWTDYQRTQTTSAQALIARGEVALHALEGGIRSHRRVGAWFRSNATSVLENTVAVTPDFLTLAVFDEDGNLIASGGQAPDTLEPTRQPQWTDDGLVVSLRTRLVAPEGVGDHEGGGLGPRWRQEEGSDDQDLGPMWLTALLDDGPYREEAGREWRRFLVWLSIGLAAVALAMATSTLVEHRGRMAVDLDLAREREDRLEELTRLGAGLAHETKNPLSLIRGMAQSLAKHAGDADKARTASQRIIDEADRVVARVDSFLRFSRPVSPEARAIDLKAIVDETLELLFDEAAARGVELRRPTLSVRAMADPDLLRQALVNLMVNALAACADGGVVGIVIARGAPGRLTLEARDDGVGIAPEDLPKVSEPYFTRREGGTGMGLAVVDQIVQAHGWRLDIESTVGQGTSVTITGIEEAPPQ
jgi:signal transduction histidine kinase